MSVTKMASDDFGCHLYELDRLSLAVVYFDLDPRALTSHY
jgi:hypothetical protein